MNFFLVAKKLRGSETHDIFTKTCRIVSWCLPNVVVVVFFFCENELQRWTSSLVLYKMIQSAKIYVKKYLLSFRRPRLFSKTLPLLFPSLFRVMLRCSLSPVWKGEISEEPFFPWPSRQLSFKGFSPQHR